MEAHSPLLGTLKPCLDAYTTTTFFLFSPCYHSCTACDRKIKGRVEEERGSMALIWCSFQLLTMAFAHLVLHIILSIKVQPSRLCLECTKTKRACHINFLWIIDLTDRVIYIPWVMWVSSYTRSAPVNAEACIKILRYGVHYTLLAASSELWCRSPHQRPI